jgi:hypothetical protein
VVEAEVKKARRLLHPAYIVYIVKQTIGTAIEGKAPNSWKVPRADMACGSGSFLLGAYQYLLDYYLKWYTDPSPSGEGGVSS